MISLRLNKEKPRDILAQEIVIFLLDTKYREHLIDVDFQNNLLVAEDPEFTKEREKFINNAKIWDGKSRRASLRANARKY